MAVTARLVPPNGKGRFRRVPAKTCSKCGEIRVLRGPNFSARLQKWFWVQSCSSRRPDYEQTEHDAPIPYWENESGQMEPIPIDSIERMHSRAAYSFSIPKCCGYAMNPQPKQHLTDDGRAVTILHCRCRKCGIGTHDVYLVLPSGIKALRERRGVFMWTSEFGKITRTKWRRAEDRTSKFWRPADWWDKSIDYRIVGSELLSKAYMSNEELGKRLDSSRLLKCPYGTDGWEIALRGSGRAANYVTEIRKWVNRPGKRPEPKARVNH